MPGPIDRILLFKIKEDQVDNVLEVWANFEKTAVKDGNPYILSVRAQRTRSDTKREGFNVCIRLQFALYEDVKYYNEECAAHKKVKEAVLPHADGPLKDAFIAIGLDN